MDWKCCWTREGIDPRDCPEFREGDEALLSSLPLRVAERCISCDRFRDDLHLMAGEDPKVARLVTCLAEGLRYQKAQLASLAGSLDSSRQEISFIHELTEVLQTTMNLDEVLSVAMTAITAGTGFGMNRAFLLLTDKPQHNLGMGPRNIEEAWQTWDEIDRHNYSLIELAAHFFTTKLRSEKAKFADLMEQLSLLMKQEGHILNRALAGRKPLLVDQEMIAAEGDNGLAELLGADSYIIMPLISRNRQVGVILADNYVTHQGVTPKDLESLETFGFAVALAIERGSLYEQLQEKVERLVEANQKLLDQQEQIVRMEKHALVGQLTSSIAHSIRNPLMTIGGFARSLLAKSRESDPLRGSLLSLSSAAQQLDDVLNEVLAVSDTFSPNQDRWDVNLLVRLVSEELAERLLSRGIAVSLDLAPDLPLAYIDFRQISFCVRTIIINLLDFLPDGSTVTIATRQTDMGITIEAGGGPGAAQNSANTLGIMVCRNILENQGIPFTITMTDLGVRFRITVPVERRD